MLLFIIGRENDKTYWGSLLLTYKYNENNLQHRCIGDGIKLTCYKL